MPIRVRVSEDFAACVSVLWRVHEADGYPARWPEDPASWLTPARSIAAWVVESAGSIVGHVGLVQEVDVPCVLRATGRQPSQLAALVRLFVDPAARRAGWAHRLVDGAAVHAVANDLLPVLDVVDNARPAINLYEKLGWDPVGSQDATWTMPSGIKPILRYYIKP